MKTAKNTYKFSVNIRGYRRQSVVGGGVKKFLRPTSLSAIRRLLLTRVNRGKS